MCHSVSPFQVLEPHSGSGLGLVLGAGPPGFLLDDLWSSVGPLLFVGAVLYSTFLE